MCMCVCFIEQLPDFTSVSFCGLFMFAVVLCTLLTSVVFMVLFWKVCAAACYQQNLALEP